jgi:hypothetical protein
MRICSIFGCDYPVESCGLCLLHRSQSFHRTLRTHYRKEINVPWSQQAFHRALIKLAEKAVVDSDWASVSDELIDRQLNVSRQCRAADFAEFAARCALKPTASKKRKLALMTQIREIASRFKAQSEGQSHYLALRAALESCNDG